MCCIYIGYVDNSRFLSVEIGQNVLFESRRKTDDFCGWKVEKTVLRNYTWKCCCCCYFVLKVKCRIYLILSSYSFVEVFFPYSSSTSFPPSSLYNENVFASNSIFIQFVWFSFIFSFVSVFVCVFVSFWYQKNIIIFVHPQYTWSDEIERERENKRRNQMSVV